MSVYRPNDLPTLTAFVVVMGLSGCLKDSSAVDDQNSAYWHERLRSSDLGHRREAALELWSLGPEGAAAVPELIGCLRDRDAELKINAAGALGSMGTAAKLAAPALVPLLREQDATVRDAAAAALGKLEVSSPEVVSALARALKDKDPTVRIR